MDFRKSVFENKQAKRTPFLAAHRGMVGANVPCNTLLAFELAIAGGADVVELDVTRSRDGVYFVFHPGKENVYLKCGKSIPEMTADEVLRTPLLGAEQVPTHYRVPTLEQAFALLRGKVYINVDKFWTDVEGITRVIRAAGVERQVIVKTPVGEEYFSEIERVAPDLMYMPLARHTDTVTEQLAGRRINYIGVEALFDRLDDEVATPQYVRAMHQKGLLVWANSIIYDERDVIAADLTDDTSLEKGGDAGWGKLADIGFDFIQTDWLLHARAYFESRK